MSTSQEPEHPIVTLLSLQEHLGNLTRQHKGLHVKRDTSVTQALDNVISYPFVSFNLPPYLSEYSFEGTDETAFGALDSPNTDAIRSQSLPSSFGRGDQTVIDPDVPKWARGSRGRFQMVRLSARRSGLSPPRFRAEECPRNNIVRRKRSRYPAV